MATQLRKRRLLYGSGVIGVLLFLAALLAPAIPPNEEFWSKSHYCKRCGIQRHLSSTNTVTDPPQVLSYEEESHITSLSAWHAAHYGPCEHTWRYNHSAYLRYFRIRSQRFFQLSEAGSAVTPDLIRLSPEDQEHLERLFQANPIECQEHIEFVLNRRGRE